MILPNGYIEIETKTGGGIGENGHAIACVVSYADKRYCQFIKHEDLQKRTEGEAVTGLSYNIYIDIDGQEFAAERIRLSDKHGRVLGIYSVRSIEELEAVGQYLLTV